MVSKNQFLRQKTLLPLKALAVLTAFIINLMPALKESVLTIMKINSIVAFEDSILFNVDANVPAYKADESGAMVQTEDTQFSMSYSDLARQAYPLNPDIAELRALRGQHLSGEDWIKLLTGATINVEFTFVKEGDEVDGFTYENTGYIKTLKSLKLTDRVAERLDRALGF